MSVSYDQWKLFSLLHKITVHLTINGILDLNCSSFTGQSVFFPTWPRSLWRLRFDAMVLSILFKNCKANRLIWGSFRNCNSEHTYFSRISIVFQGERKGQSL